MPFSKFRVSLARNNIFDAVKSILLHSIICTRTTDYSAFKKYRNTRANHGQSQHRKYANIQSQCRKHVTLTSILFAATLVDYSIWQKLKKPRPPTLYGEHFFLFFASGCTIFLQFIRRRTPPPPVILPTPPPFWVQAAASTSAVLQRSLLGGND